MSKPPHRILSDSLRFTVEKYPDDIAAVVEGTPYSYKTLNDASKKLAAFLLQQGIQRGDRVAIFMENSWECITAIYAVQLCGAVFVVINPQTKSDKLQYIINDSDASALICDTKLEKSFTPAITSESSLKTIIFHGDLSASNVFCPTHKYTSIIESEVDSSALQDNPVIALDLCALIYTSGSTGEPKGVMQTHGSMVFALQSLVEYLRLSKSDRILCALPLAFDYGLYQLLMSVYLGATLVLEKSFTYPTLIFNRMRDENVTVFPAVPTMFSMTIAAHNREPLHFPSVTRVTNTAAALPADFIPALTDIFPQALIYKMYGLTECKRACYLPPEMLKHKPTSVGKAIPGTEMFLLSSSGKKAKPGEHGILHIRGPHIMRGYWKKPEETANTLLTHLYPNETILCTNDTLYQDDEGYFYFVGRNDDIIKTKGEKVSPVEVENALHSIDGIKEAAVIGIDDNVLGESITAFISPKSGTTLNINKIKKECMQRLESYMVPKDFIIMQELPKTNTGKIDKKPLKASVYQE